MSPSIPRDTSVGRRAMMKGSSHGVTERLLVQTFIRRSGSIGLLGDNCRAFD
jgi:hypothetical protein